VHTAKELAYNALKFAEYKVTEDIEKAIEAAEQAHRTGIRSSTIYDIYHNNIDRINFAHLDRICKVLNGPILYYKNDLAV